ncbi:TPA: IS5/IS1182 family transposase, partial [Enterococcus faecium]|nr:IS5/IS1182 family transposase [Enterococcus faecium]HBK5510523.1 IS5/IS1182 family transposase [Enterococcus faecium]HBK5736719.1 IS5/IS1182 family transposase [Enterococcus faecium]HBK5762034.1 IS5/IS1182 family transposase [Enterococcus faecium]
KGKEPLFFCSKIRNEVDKKLFQARVTSLEQLLSTVCHYYQNNVKNKKELSITVIQIILSKLHSKC